MGIMAIPQLAHIWPSNMTADVHIGMRKNSDGSLGIYWQLHIQTDLLLAEIYLEINLM
jgi:hypothetical protein